MLTPSSSVAAAGANCIMLCRGSGCNAPCKSTPSCYILHGLLTISISQRHLGRHQSGYVSPGDDELTFRSCLVRQVVIRVRLARRPEMMGAGDLQKPPAASGWSGVAQSSSRSPCMAKPGQNQQIKGLRSVSKHLPEILLRLQSLRLVIKKRSSRRSPRGGGGTPPGNSPGYCFSYCYSSSLRILSPTTTAYGLRFVISPQRVCSPAGCACFD